MKRILAVVISLMMFMTGAISVSAYDGPGKIFISHVYGGGGKGDTPITNSFIELQNTGSSECSLSGYSLVYGDKTLALEGTIPAEGSFLVIGAAETTSDDLITLDLPQADMNCDWVIDNKDYTIKLLSGETEADSVTAAENTETAISKQKSLKHDADGNYSIIVWKKGETEVTSENVASYSPENSKGEIGTIHSAGSEPTVPSEPVFTSVTAGDSRVKGFFNGDSSLDLELAGRYNSEAMNADGGSLEIVDFNEVNGYAYAVSGVKGKVIAVNMNESMSGDKVKNLSGTEFNLKDAIEAKLAGFVYGDITSVSVSPDGSHLAAAVQAAGNSDAGAAAIFSCGDDGSLELVNAVKVGVQPDMIVFADNGTILTADEGEPREGKDNDPEGSVSIVKISGDDATSESVYFDKYDAQRDDLTAAGVLVQKGIDPSKDFEPEYIAVSGNKAYVSLQEANAIAVLDIAKADFTGVYPLGLQDYSSVKADLEKNDKAELNNYDNVYGIKMPDGIAAKEIGGKVYILTANEGDSRADWPGMDNEYESKTSPEGNVSFDSKVVWFNADMWDGLDSSKAYVFGGRSFSIYEASDDGLKLVYDSGSSFEEVTLQKIPEYFNCSNDKTTLDNRSGKKGPEPETVTTGVVDGKTYAFIALERIGGIAVYDITSPSETKFVNYINSREFDSAIQGDVSPEGLKFVSSTKGSDGKPVLMAACEVSGTLAVYSCSAVKSSAAETEKKTITALKLSYNNYTYNGKTRTPSVTVTDASGKVLKKGTDYNVTYQSGRKYVGKYKVTVTGTGSCTGSKSAYFTISPKGTYIKSISKGKKKFTVKWKKQTVQTTGYQIKYSRYSSMKNAKYVTVKKSKTTCKTIKKLKSHKKYYVKIRTYKVVNGVKYYSSWSKTKTVRTK